jgi:hypothetical protein
MKQLLSLFLFLLPCLALAQYPSNGNQKITLGEQTTADGLIYRGVLADTGIITPLSDTSAYIILDTVNHRFYNYNRATNVWSMAGGGTSVTTFSAGATGLTPSTATSGAVTLGGVLNISNGGTGSSTQNFVGLTGNQTGITGQKGFNNLCTFTTIEAGLISNDSNFIVRNTNAYSTSLFRDILYRSSTLSNNVQPLANIRFATVGPIASEISFLTRATAGNYDVRMVVNSTGNVGIGQTTPTAVLHLKAGTATASTGPLKFTSGTNLTTAEAGAMEFNGTNLFFSPSTTRHTVNHGLTGSATLDFPSTLTMLSADRTITVTGAADGDVVSLGVPNAAVNANTSYSAWVSAANTVTVRFNNYSIGTVDPASALFKVFVTK